MERIKGKGEKKKMKQIPENQLTLQELIKQSYENAKAHGFWDESFNPRCRFILEEKLLLLHAEITEAFEEIRNYRQTDKLDFNITKEIITDAVYTTMHPSKPEGFITEIADIFIRLADLCGALQEECGFDIEKMINIKHEYNKTRPHKHGKAC